MVKKRGTLVPEGHTHAAHLVPQAHTTEHPPAQTPAAMPLTSTPSESEPARVVVGAASHGMLKGEAVLF
jgi:hypothetical protein